MAKLTRRRLTTAEVIKINDLLRHNLVKVVGTDKWEYLNGYTDRKLATEIDKDLDINHVLKIRTEQYGRLNGGIQQTFLSVTRQEVMINTLVDRFNALAISTGNVNLVIKETD